MKLQEFKIEDLKIFEPNIKLNLDKNDKEYIDIKCSILAFGFIMPLIISNNNYIIDGVTRLKILKELSYRKVNCIKLDIVNNNAKILRVSLNKSKGDWNILSLKEFFKTLDQEIKKYGHNVIGFDKEEIELILTIDEFPDLEDNNKDEPKQLGLDIFREEE